VTLFSVFIFTPQKSFYKNIIRIFKNSNIFEIDIADFLFHVIIKESRKGGI
jgi:hypothetical protein